MKTYSPPVFSPATKPQPNTGLVPVAQVAHGLNNTRTVINGFGELLLGMMSEGDPHRRYAEVTASGKRSRPRRPSKSGAPMLPKWTCWCPIS